PRNVGTPLSAEMPAPVKTTTRVEGIGNDCSLLENWTGITQPTRSALQKGFNTRRRCRLCQGTLRLPETSGNPLIRAIPRPLDKPNSGRCRRCDGNQKTAKVSR